MPTKKPPKKERNSVWIELEKPRDNAHAKEICEKANRMLVRLQSVADQEEGRCGYFAWSESRSMFMYGTNMGMKYLTDRGEWFSLDYVGRE